MSVDILGVKYPVRSVWRRSAASAPSIADGELAGATAAKAGDHLQILSTRQPTASKTCAPRAATPIWLQLYATNKWEVASTRKRAENAAASPSP